MSYQEPRKSKFKGRMTFNWCQYLGESNSGIDKGFKATIMKMVQQSNTYSLETNKKLKS